MLPDNNSKLPWYFNQTSLVVGFLCVGPLILPLVWLHPKMKTSTKIVWTLVAAVLTYAMVVVTLDSIKKIQEMYQQVNF